MKCSPPWWRISGPAVRFAEFLREKSDGMVRQAAVGVEREGKLRIQVDRSVSPEETLPLTKSILTGARKDFPGKAFTLDNFRSLAYDSLCATSGCERLSIRPASLRALAPLWLSRSRASALEPMH